MRFTVCISTLNRRDKLKRCIDSVVSQTRYPDEIIVIDNNSSDGTQSILYDYYAAYSNFKIVFLNYDEPNAIKSINDALKMASSDFILLLDDDAYFPDDHTIDIIIEDIYAKDRQLGYSPRIIGCNVIDKNGKPQLSHLDDAYEFHGAGVVFKNGVLYDESFQIYVNEFELSCRMSALGHKTYINSQATVVHDETLDMCNMRKLQFIKNYNTVVRRYFNHYRFRITLLKDIQLIGYFTKFNLKNCSKINVVKFILHSVYITLHDILHLIITRCNVTFEIQRKMEDSIYSDLRYFYIDKIHNIYKSICDRINDYL